MKEEIFLDSGKLVSQEQWVERISAIKSTVSLDLTSKAAAIDAVGEALTNAILKRIPQSDKFGVMFSGGVDSSFIAFIAKKSGRPFTCYTVGFKEDETKQPEDLDSAIEAAKLLGVELKYKVLSLSESERIIKKTVKMLGQDLSNVVNVGVGAVVVACIEMAEKDGVKILFSGLGSEEIFAGYERHKKASDINAECWNGLFKMYERDLLRDSAIANATGVGFMTPFLDPGLINMAMRVPADLKIDGGQAKVILRQAAEKDGLPKSIAWRPKRAAQYGSRLDRAIDKLSRKAGFEFKKDYLASIGK